MDFYGPRIPIGGGALYGKDFRHIDTLFNDKKVSYAPLEGLEGCMNLFPRTYNKKTRGH